MKNLRKPVSLLICLVMALCLASAAYAANSSEDVALPDACTTQPAATDDVPDVPSELPTTV